MSNIKQVKQSKKLIEVALPLDIINKACRREKSIRHGHPSTLHLWWARRPLAAARAIIFAQIVDDPSEYVDALISDPKKKKIANKELKKRIVVHAAKHSIKIKLSGGEGSNPVSRSHSTGEEVIAEPKPTLHEVIAEIERERLFAILEELVLWENTANKEVIQRAQDEIWQSWRRTCEKNTDHPRATYLFDRNKLPKFHDPFAGGGTLPLEAQRLGLESFASDLNPVAVLINKAMIEIPPKFAGKPPVNPESRADEMRRSYKWEGAQGLAEDVRYYGEWMRNKAKEQIGHLYPPVKVTAKMTENRPELKRYVNRELTVIAWLWARTVKSPNPAFANVDVPLVKSFMLNAKPGKEIYVAPVITNANYSFSIKSGTPQNPETTSHGTAAGRRDAFICLMSGVPITYDYIRSEGTAGRMSTRLLAIVAEGDRERVYLAPSSQQEAIANNVTVAWKPDLEIPNDPSAVRTPNYGLTTYGDLFTSRQIKALTTFADLVQDARERIKNDALLTSLPHESKSFVTGDISSAAYADAISMYLGLGVGRSADYWSALTPWSNNFIGHTFGRQAIPMVWDYAEGNPLSTSTGNWTGALVWIQKAMITALPASESGVATQKDAQTQDISRDKIVSTDPPYYDNICYAPLSDFFYVWLRRALRPIFPNEFLTLATPKAEELVATPYRHGNKAAAEAFFLNGMRDAMQCLVAQVHPAFPVTIYYAFKQSETNRDTGTASTGWETFLDAVIDSGLSISGTWPLHTERNYGLKTGKNALASSIILVCRPRSPEAKTATRREFINSLKANLPPAVTHLQRDNIAPVDLAQAALGPGMAVYTRYARVLESDGSHLTVRTALELINQVLDETLVQQEGDLDADSRWALSWFKQYGFTEGEFGVAETLSKAKNTSVAGLSDAGILVSKAGKVRLLKPVELPNQWSPNADPRLTAWEIVHHLIRVLEADGESAAAELVAKLGAKAETARELCYRLYTFCERKKRASEALPYNTLVQSWPEITRLAHDDNTSGEEHASLFGPD